MAWAVRKLAGTVSAHAIPSLESVPWAVKMAGLVLNALKVGYTKMSLSYTHSCLRNVLFSMGIL